MKVAPLPTLLLATLLQIVLAGPLISFALKASITHQRAANLYAEKARLSEKTVPVATLQLQVEAVSASDRSLTTCLLLSSGIVALSLVQLWLVMDVRNEAKRQIAKSHVS